MIIENSNERLFYRQVLTDLGFNINSVGFDYWIDAIILYKDKCRKYDNTIMSIYDAIGEKYNFKGSKQVERNLRTARQTADKNIQEAFNYRLKITNKVALRLLTKNIENIYNKVNKQQFSSLYGIMANTENHIPHID